VSELEIHAPLVRADLLHLDPVPHGSVAADELAAYGLQLADVLDFSVSTNPLGAAPSVLQAITHTDWGRYPGDDEAPLRRALAHRARVYADQIALGNGSAELLWLICLAVLRPGDTVAIAGPTFGEYARAARAVGAQLSELRDLADFSGARILFVCQPNNPTGAYRDRGSIERLLIDQPDCLVVLDEAFVAFVADPWPAESLLADYPNLVILRSMTKDHALPGLRLGYLLAAPQVARAVEVVRPPWSVNAGALRAGLATLQPEAARHLARARAVVSESRQLLTDGFSRLGYRAYPSAANFLLVEVGDGEAFRRSLLPLGFVVRDCASFGLPTYVRVACRLPEECARLFQAIEKVQPSPA
jgi:histidinol-phosphate aminotransferase